MTRGRALVWVVVWVVLAFAAAWVGQQWWPAWVVFVVAALGLLGAVSVVAKGGVDDQHE